MRATWMWAEKAVTWEEFQGNGKTLILGVRTGGFVIHCPILKKSLLKSLKNRVNRDPLFFAEDSFFSAEKLLLLSLKRRGSEETPGWAYHSFLFHAIHTTGVNEADWWGVPGWNRVYRQQTNRWERVQKMATENEEKPEKWRWNEGPPYMYDYLEDVTDFQGLIDSSEERR